MITIATSRRAELLARLDAAVAERDAAVEAVRSLAPGDDPNPIHERRDEAGRTVSRLRTQLSNVAVAELLVAAEPLVADLRAVAHELDELQVAHPEVGPALRDHDAAFLVDALGALGGWLEDRWDAVHAAALRVLA